MSISSRKERMERERWNYVYERERWRNRKKKLKGQFSLSLDFLDEIELFTDAKAASTNRDIIKSSHNFNQWKN